MGIKSLHINSTVPNDEENSPQKKLIGVQSTHTHTQQYVPEDAPKYQIKSKFCDAVYKANYLASKRRNERKKNQKRCWLLRIDQVNWWKNVFKEFGRNKTVGIEHEKNNAT